MPNRLTRVELKARIERDFRWISPGIGQIARMGAIRLMCKKLALFIVETTPTSREQSLALTHLEQVSMFANASIVRNENRTND